MAHALDGTDVVGAAVAVSVADAPTRYGAAGLRRVNGDAPLLASDTFHIGSITKSVTATLIAVLVDDGTLSWGQTVAEAFPDAHPDWSGVTLEALLSHTAGVQANAPASVLGARAPETTECIVTQRHDVAADALSKPLSHAAGAYRYSNMGYIIAGAWAEAASGTDWQILVSERVLGPLGIAHGFGAPRGANAPFGHTAFGSKRFPADPEGGAADNAPVVGPAGRLHMTLDGMIAWGRFHLGDGSPLLSGDALSDLHTPRLDAGQDLGYALGWLVDADNPAFGGGPMIWHNGSNLRWTAVLILLPDEDAVLTFASNDGDIAASQGAFFDVARQVARKEGWAED